MLRDDKKPRDVNVDILCDWKRRIIKQIPKYDYGVWSDSFAMSHFHNRKTFFDKKAVAQTFEQGTSYFIEDLQSIARYPVVVKPRTQLDGISEVDKCFNLADISRAIGKRGNKLCIVQDAFQGDYFNAQCLIVNKSIVGAFCFTAEMSRSGYPKCYESVDHTKGVWKKYFRKVKDIVALVDVRRVLMTIEMIGGHVIDIRFRPEIMFYDISGGIIKQYPETMRVGSFSAVSFEKTYCRIYSISEDTYASIKRKDIPEHDTSKMRSINFMFSENKKLSDMPNNGSYYNLFFINGTCLNYMEDYAKRIFSKIVFSDRKRL